jgi:tetratricopeptide (TPR) repeat protein
MPARPGSAEWAIDSVASPGALAAFLALSGRFAEAETVASGLLLDGPPSRGEDAPTVYATWGLAFAHAMLGRIREAEAAYAAARRGFDTLDQHRLLLIAIRDELAFVTLPCRADQPADRERLVAASIKAAARGYAASAYVDTVDNERYPLLHVTALEGRWQEVRDVIDAMSDYGIPIIRHVASSKLGPIARAQGNRERAWKLVRDTWPAGPDAPLDDLYHTLPLHRLAIELALDDGDQAEALACLDAHADWLDRTGTVLGRSEWALLWARHARLGGNRESAFGHAEAALAHAAAPHQPLALLAAHRFLGQLHMDEGNPDDAREHLGRARALADRCGAPYELAQTLLVQAAWHVGKGAPARAIAMLETARGICLDLNATPMLASIEQWVHDIAERMAAVLGLEQPLSLSVFTASAAGFALAAIPNEAYAWNLDQVLARPAKGHEASRMMDP